MEDKSGRLPGPRAIAVLGPFAAGKTSLLEAILMRCGTITRQGKVGDGNTVGDASPEARAHAMSVEANVAEAEFMGDRYTFIDCPGSIEFQHAAMAALPGVDLAVVVAEADPKKIAALQLCLRDLEDRGVPHALFLNKVDKLGESVRDVLTMLQAASGLPLVLRQIPMRKGGEITGFIDLALERAFVYHDGAPSEVVEIPEGEQDRGHEARFGMLEKIADFDDTLLEQLLEDVEPERATIFADLVSEFRQGLICPVFIGSAEHGFGVGRLLKALRHEAPTVAETRERLGITDPDALCLQVIKTSHAGHGGKLSIARVLAGELRDNAVLRGPDGAEGKVSGLLRLNGGDWVKTDRAGAGETIAIGKFDAARTGDTLHAGNGQADAAARNLAPLAEIQPVMAVAVAPRERKDDVRLSSALGKLIEEDPSLRLVQVPETGETVLEGQGEMHLRVALERLTGKYGVAVETSVPKVAYRETIRKSVTLRGRHKKQSGGHGQFGDVVIEIKPLARGEGFAFDETITGGAVPKQYISSVETGVREYVASGGPLGFPVVDIAVTLTDGSYHTVDSSDQAFKAAAQIAMREGMPECSPVLLEPIFDVTVYCPSEANARINAILSSRRGQILGSDTRDGWSGWDEVRALMPAADIQDLIVELRSATAGVGTFVQKFDHFAELTGKLAEEVMSRQGTKAA
ncbi:MAG TPA: elongation factor G [Devosiaceae bacterium]